MEKLVRCKVCGEEIAKSARACPKCGAKRKKHTLLTCFLVLIGISFLFSAFSDGKDTGTRLQPVSSQGDFQDVGSQIVAKSTETPEKPKVPREYENALKQAQFYSDNMHMSRMGIFEQLTSEYGGNFPPEAAQYAIDNVEADFKANALETAKSYYEKMNMSKEAVREQLVSAYGERFTHEEADYAIDNLD